YSAVGNHDVGGARGAPSLRMHGACGEAAAPPGARGGAAGARARWRWRCPGMGPYSVSEDWRAAGFDLAPLPAGLVDLLVLNTNKFQIGMRLQDGEFDWDAQKRWLRDALRQSECTWKLVVGHHPVEFVPHSLLEHAVPGLRWLTATFMTGKPLLKKLFSSSVADVIITEGADAYLCGHQHLMAHLVRRVLPRRLALRRHPGARPGCSYVIVGSSSKTERGDGWLGAVSALVRRKLEDTRRKMRELWWSERIGFCSVQACPRRLRFEFFSVNQAGEASSVYEYSINRSASG
ncbi:unnamed protein product, partial [Prorocentrum cordatum]